MPQVFLDIYDPMGRRIKTEFAGFSPAGRNEISLNASDLSSGLYLLKLVTEAGVPRVEKLVLIR